LAYFTSDANVAGNVTLGDPVNINVTQGGSAVTSLTFSDNVLPGHVYDQVIGVSVPADTSNALLRAKLTISNTDGLTINVQATTVDSWIEADDDYYYYVKAVPKVMVYTSDPEDDEFDPPSGEDAAEDYEG
jgi:hypothetical protein